MVKNIKSFTKVHKYMYTKYIFFLITTLKKRVTSCFREPYGPYNRLYTILSRIVEKLDMIDIHVSM